MALSSFSSFISIDESQMNQQILTIKNLWIQRRWPKVIFNFLLNFIHKFLGLADGVDPFLSYRTLPKKDWLDKDFYEAEQKRVGNGEQGRAHPVSNKDNETLTKLMVGRIFIIFNGNKTKYCLMN
jgi:hypothetical protein